MTPRAWPCDVHDLATGTRERRIMVRKTWASVGGEEILLDADGLAYAPHPSKLGVVRCPEHDHKPLPPVAEDDD